MDYVQLRFDGPTDDVPILNCDVMPGVETAAGALLPGQLGYADALLGFIPKVVTVTTEQTGQGLRIGFEDGTIVLHPQVGELIGPEIALLRGSKGRELDVLATR